MALPRSSFSHCQCVVGSYTLKGTGYRTRSFDEEAIDVRSSGQGMYKRNTWERGGAFYRELFVESQFISGIASHVLPLLRHSLYAIAHNCWHNSRVSILSWSVIVVNTNAHFRWRKKCLLINFAENSASVQINYKLVLPTLCYAISFYYFYEKKYAHDLIWQYKNINMNK